MASLIPWDRHTSPTFCRDWLEFVQTASARNHIRRWLRRQERSLNIAAGRDMLEREINRMGMSISFDDVVEANNFKNIEDLFAAIGVGDHRPRELVQRVIGKQQAHQTDLDPLAELPNTLSEPVEPPKISIQVQGTNETRTRLARCCNPIEGDNVVGFVTHGKGITVHRADCHNILHERDQSRLIPVSWGSSNKQQSYPVPIRIEAWERAGLWRDITNAVADANGNIQAFQQVENRHPGRATLLVTLLIDSLTELTTILDRLSRLPNIIDVHRERSQDSNP